MRTQPITIAAVVVILLAGMSHGAPPVPAAVSRDAWTMDRSQLLWLDDESKAAAKQGGTIPVGGWADYDFSLTSAGWYELWFSGAVPTNPRDVFIDGKLDARLVISDAELDTDGKQCKEMNVLLSAGKHTLRYRRLDHPSGLPSHWELRAANGRPEASIRVRTSVADRVVRAGQEVKYTVQGGCATPTRYEFAIAKLDSNQTVPVGTVEFPASETMIEKPLTIRFPSEGVWRVITTTGSITLRPADVKVANVIVVDPLAVTPSEKLQQHLVTEIDCVAQTINGKPAVPGQTFFEQGGASRIVRSTLGNYRATTGPGPNVQWGLDGFSYRFSLPDAQKLYHLEVDYPDDDRRSMGFWIDDNASNVSNVNGSIATGGVETGDAYLLTRKMQTYEAFFYPRDNAHVLFAALNLTPAAMGAAAARVRIYEVDGPLPAAHESETKSPREIAYYFEEAGRWVRHFGGPDDSPQSNLLSLQRWAEWARFGGARLLWPTVNVYQANYYPSEVLEGYFCRPYNYLRVCALEAQKYGCQFVPEFHVSGTPWFDQEVMGVVRHGLGDRLTISFRTPEDEEVVSRSFTGSLKFSRKPYVFNALNPRVQQKYIDALGEAADSVADCPSFKGISSRLMITWQWMGFNGLPGLKYGYEDWTIALFEKETGITVPGNPGDPDRYRARFDYLTGAAKTQWVHWRCQKIFEYHCRLRDRLRKAKPDAVLYLTSPETESSFTLSSDPIEQMIEMGIDPKMYEGVDGIAIVPTAMFGRRYSTPASDAAWRSARTTDFFSHLADTGPRAAMLWSAYFEVNANLDWTKLGGTEKYGAFDSCIPSGVYERELYAAALANNDASVIAIGANGAYAGRPTVMGPWIERFNAIPARRFERAPTPQDPVAVWQSRDATGLMFYAVNRLSVPVQVKLAVSSGVAVAIVGDSHRAAEQRDSDGAISFTLDPFMPQVFHADGADVKLTGCQVTGQSPWVDQARPAVDFAQALLPRLANRSLAPELSVQDAQRAAGLIDQAKTSLASGAPGTAREVLLDPLMVRLYDSAGRYPPGLMDRQTPLGYVDAADAPQVVPIAAKNESSSQRSTLGGVTALRSLANGSVLVAAADQCSLFDAGGTLQRNLCLLDESEYATSGNRGDRLGPPVPMNLSHVAIASNGDVLAMAGAGVNRYEPIEGRRFSGAGGKGPWLRLPAMAGALLAGPDSQGSLYIGGGKAGLLKYHPDGTPACDFAGQTSNVVTSIAPTAMDVDASGRLYCIQGGTLKIIDAGGATTASVPLPLKARQIAVASDGTSLAVTDRSTVCLLNRAGDGAFQLAGKWASSVDVTAITFASDGAVLVGLEGPIEGAVVWRLKQDGNALRPTQAVVRSCSPEKLSQPTPLKMFEGRAFYFAGGRLCEVSPGGPSLAKTVADVSSVTLSPLGFAFTRDGNLLICYRGEDAKSAGRRFAIARRAGGKWGTPVPVAGLPTIGDFPSASITDLAIDSAGKILLVADTGAPSSKGTVKALIAIDLEKKSSRQIAALPDDAGTRGYGLRTTDDGRIFLADAAGARVAAFGGDGQPLWQRMSSLDRSHGALPLRAPVGLDLDAAGHLWVADAAADQIVCLDASNGRFLATFGCHGSGIDGEHGDLFQPSGLLAMTAGATPQLLIADAGNRRLLAFETRSAKP